MSWLQDRVAAARLALARHPKRELLRHSEGVVRVPEPLPNQPGSEQP